MADWRDIRATDGTAQADRLPFALREGYFLVDEMSFEQLLAVSTELSQVIAFYGQDGERRGTWSEMFHGNEAALMALILAKDTRRMEAEFARCLEEGLESCVSYAYGLARFIDFCLRKLHRLESRAALEFSERITVLVRERLASRLGELGRITAALEQAGPLAFSPDFGDFDPAWGMRAPQDPVCSPCGVSGAGSPDVRRVFQAFSAAIAYLKSLVGPYLAESLQTRDHDPAMGLFVTFLRLFGAAQTQLNAFTERHLDFYYRRVLGTAPRPAVGDRALLALRTSGVARSVTIDAGTRWLASGPAPGDVRVFTSRAPMVVRPARVSALCTMHLQRDRRISAERELGYVTRIKSARLPVVAPDLAAGPRQAWPLFGTQHLAGAASVAQDAALGFAVASPALLLKEGTRRISLSLYLEDPAAPERFMEEVSHRLVTGAQPCEDVITEAFATHLRSASEVFGRLSPVDADREARQLAKALCSEERGQALQGPVAGGRNRLYDLLLRAALRREGPDQERRFCTVFGAIFRRHLLGASQAIDEDYRREILTRAAEVLPPDGMAVVRGLLETGHTGLFERLLGDALEVSLTTETGWHRVPRWVVTRPDPEPGTGQRAAGLRFRMSLAPDVAAVAAYRAEVHGDDLGTRSPVIRLRLCERASFCAYSVLSGFALKSVVIDTAVRGVRDLRVSNNLGPVDPSRPFNPFGPLPAVGAYMTLGSYELARKRIKRLIVNLEWSDLPTVYGGFAAHYAGYQRDFANDDFTVEQSVLLDGNWLPETSRQRPTSTLFERGGMTERLGVKGALEVKVLDYLRPLEPTAREEDFDLPSGARKGFFRFTLSGPDGAFGHAAYPLLLASALARNLRSKAQPQVPNPPYTPSLAGVALDYESSDVVRFGDTGPEDGEDMAEAVFHLHPFGAEVVRAGQGPPLLMPSYSTDGNLFIGLDGEVGGGVMALMFHLSGETYSRTAFEPPDSAWFYLAPEGWRRLPAFRVVSDTTRGLMRSGVVSLDLPADFDRHGGCMPPGPAWLRVGVNAHLEAFPGLCAVHTNGLEVGSTTDGGQAPAADAPGARDWRSESAIPGLEAVLQVGECFGGAPAETRAQFRTRVSERLRHKMRAVTPWDYERLILERFPRIFKVKCFSSMVSSTPAPAPGNVLVVVVPKVDDSAPCAHPMASVLELVEIRDYVADFASPFVDIEVRNPTYERVQVRCAVKFTSIGNDAWYTRRLNAEITAYLSPWTAVGYRARFGWQIRRDDVEGFVRSREYVEFLTDFSMLHVAESDEVVYSLGDTARPEDATSALAGIRPRYPWSLALPMQRHYIQPLRTMQAIRAEVTGVDELEVGSTFIVGGHP